MFCFIPDMVHIRLYNCIVAFMLCLLTYHISLMAGPCFETDRLHSHNAQRHVTENMTLILVAILCHHGSVDPAASLVKHHSLHNAVAVCHHNFMQSVITT